MILNHLHMKLDKNFVESNQFDVYAIQETPAEKNDNEITDNKEVEETEKEEKEKKKKRTNIFKKQKKEKKEEDVVDDNKVRLIQIT